MSTGLSRQKLWILYAGFVCLVLSFPARLAAGGQANSFDPRGESWDSIIKKARGSKVSFYMWGGSAEINAWIDSVVAPSLQSTYNIRLKRVPMDTGVFVNKLIAEKQSGKKSGVMDLLWINGENFKNAREADLLWGPYTDILPNFTAYVDPDSVSTDFGYPTEGYEAPYGKAWFVFEYDSARVPNPPGDIDELTSWIKANPGRFTYPQPPEFTGSAFLRLIFYHVNGNPEQFMGTYDAEKASEAIKPLIAWLKDIEPYLWQDGRSYPRDSSSMDGLFERGEIDFTMNYNPVHASSRIEAGIYPSSVRTIVPKGLALYNLHFTAIPFNAPNKAGALVLSNYLLSPEAQLSKSRPASWGDLTVLDPSRLEPEDAQAFADLNLGPATLPLDVLDAEGVPEPAAGYIEAIEIAWDKFILKE